MITAATDPRVRLRAVRAYTDLLVGLPDWCRDDHTPAARMACATAWRRVLAAGIPLFIEGRPPEGAPDPLMCVYAAVTAALRVPTRLPLSTVRLLLCALSHAPAGVRTELPEAVEYLKLVAHTAGLSNVTGSGIERLCALVCALPTVQWGPEAGVCYCAVWNAAEKAGLPLSAAETILSGSGAPTAGPASTFAALLEAPNLIRLRPAGIFAALQ